MEVVEKKSQGQLMDVEFPKVYFALRYNKGRYTFNLSLTKLRMFGLSGYSKSKVDAWLIE